MIQIIEQYHHALFLGLIETLKITCTAWCLGIVFGILLTCVSSIYAPILKKLLNSIYFILTNIPVIILLMWAYYPLQTVTGIQVSGATTTIIVLTLINTLCVAHITLDGLERFPHELRYSAHSLGVENRECFFWIELPLVLRHITPSLVGIQISILHMSLFASLLSTGELFRTGQRIISQTYTPIAVYTTLALFFLAVGSLTGSLLIWWKKKTRIYQIGTL